MADHVDHADFPFRRPEDLSNIPKGGVEREIRATEREEQAIAELLGLEALHALTATLRIKPEKKNIFQLKGRVSAEIEQVCVVSLEPIKQAVSEPIELRVRANAGAAAVAEAQNRELEFFVDEADPPEPLEASLVDLGVTAIEFLALAIDPYPRKAGVSLESYYGQELNLPLEDDGDADDQPSPFAKLQLLKDQD